jgi:hypothetical protein
MKTKVRCPFCVHDFEVETAPAVEIDADGNVVVNGDLLVKGNVKSTQDVVAFHSLKTENDDLRWENQRLQIEQHRHRGE